MRVLVGLSGGVDSAVAALLLKQEGHEVIGATMSIWGDRVVKNHKPSCKDACFSPNEKEDIASAQAIAKALDIPYYVFDCAKEYNSIVLDYFKKEYLKGRTPNPCIYCNALIKFGVLPDVARAAGVEFDKFATGHYARLEEKNGKFFLKQAIDKSKDQSYFLYRLKQEQLQNILLPLGSYTKEEIRKIASDYGLKVASKPDSQDFYDGDYNELLEVEDKKGNIVDLKGNILGTHKGIWNYTVGQRKGLGISSNEPLYVLALDKDKNEVVVGPLDKTFKKSLIASNLNLFDVSKSSIAKQSTEAQIETGIEIGIETGIGTGIGTEIGTGALTRNASTNTAIELFAKIRSSQKPVCVSVESIDKDKIKVVFDDFQKSIAIGQSVVLYKNDTVIGGGIIESAT